MSGECPICGGEGCYVLCPVCGGEGEIDGLVIGDETVRERCETCEGTGLVLETEP